MKLNISASWTAQFLRIHCAPPMPSGPGLFLSFTPHKSLHIFTHQLQISLSIKEKVFLGMHPRHRFNPSNPGRVQTASTRHAFNLVLVTALGRLKFLFKLFLKLVSLDDTDISLVWIFLTLLVTCGLSLGWREISLCGMIET